jgi:2-polyprenyl-3-methyl-5-hydroxy-6-metoxy-1,4-benzoquinol methylase
MGVETRGARLHDLFTVAISVDQNVIRRDDRSGTLGRSQQTQEVFDDKWSYVASLDERQKFYEMQFEWFLELYGFGSESEFADFLSDKDIIVDAGCGLGYKSNWFARLAPNSTVLGIDISSAVLKAADEYRSSPNLFFLKGDISDTGIQEKSVDLVVCDQVLMHTESPETTFTHLTDIVRPGGELACYVYAKKAVPRELLDDHFRRRTHQISSDEMWRFAEQLTLLGRRLSELRVTFEAPDIPMLGIKGGKYDIQRFIYWNFLKCFWNAEWGVKMSAATNFDWYAPSNARRFSRDEFEKMIADSGLKVEYFHLEEACYSGRFSKPTTQED